MKLIIVCEDSFGSDVKRIVDAINQANASHGRLASYDVTGYICPVEKKDKINISNIKCLGTIEDINPQKNEFYAMGIIDPTKKEHYAALLKQKGAEFITLRAPWVIAPETMQFGEGSIIAAHNIKERTSVGRFVTLFHAMVGAAASIGDYSSVMAFANITTAKIGRSVFVASNAAVMDEVEVGDSVYVYPNSVVVKKVKAGDSVFGIPARRIRG